MTIAPKRTPFWKRRSFHILVSATLLGILCSRLQSQDIKGLFTDADLKFIGLFFVIELADRIFMAWKWRLLLLREYPHYSLRQAIRVYLTSSATGLLLPLGGVGPDIVRIGWLKMDGVPGDAAISSVLVERLTGLLGTMIMVCFAMALLFMQLTLDDTRAFWIIFGCCFAGAALGLGILASSRLRRLLGAETWMLRLFDKVGLGPHWKAVLRYAERPALLIVSIVLSWIEQFADVVSFYFCCLAFGIDISLLHAMTIIPIAAIMGRLPISFMGIGVREASIVYMGALFGISYADAMLASITSLTLFLIMLVPILIWTMFHRREVDAAAARA
ncbi:MAG: YbhN family protein [Sphingomonadaceae bacterium]